jgi:hypothetical protein
MNRRDCGHGPPRLHPLWSAGRQSGRRLPRSIDWHRTPAQVPNPTAIAHRTPRSVQWPNRLYHFCRRWQGRRNTLGERVGRALSRRAAEHLELLAAQGATDPDATVLRATRTGCEWWTYAGLKANAALVQRFSLPRASTVSPSGRDAPPLN